ncbi:MAG: hypothetical protein M1814_001945 [Vezdaea aestivalis]|nr:MAG: hypothetical protein M1814_001945 [Vezdaea aestivalis]
MSGRVYPSTAIVPNEPACHISSEFDPPIQDDIILEIANAFGKIDRCLIREARKAVASDSQLDRALPTVKRRNELIAQAEKQLDDIWSGKYTYSNLYLRDGYIISLGHFALAEGVTGSGSNDAMRFLKELENALIPLPDALSKAVAQRVLFPEERSVICSRWLKLDDIFDGIHGLTVTKRSLIRWFNVRNMMDAVAPKPPRAPIAPSQRNTIPIYWFTISVALAAIIFMMLAYHYSTHLPGTTKESDFWFLLQNSSILFLNIETMVSAIFNDATIPARNRWGLNVALLVASVLVILACTLYAFIPKEWSGVSTGIAAIIQGFVLVQILFEKKEKKD